MDNTAGAKSLADVLGVADPREPEHVVQVERKNFRLTAKMFCKEILDSRQYRESLMRRIITDSLPPAVEQLLYYYANGKPVDRIEVRDVPADLSEVPIDQLEAHLGKLAAVARKLKPAKNVAVPASAEPDAAVTPANTSSIH